MPHPAASLARPTIAPDVLARAADVVRCLGHPLRLRLLEALEAGERTVSELQTHARAGQAAVSQQLAALKARDIVAARREGVRVYYRIVEPKVHSILNCIRACDLDE
jgi:DNA-binding transcriptional ArsR family regulator